MLYAWFLSLLLVANLKGVRQHTGLPLERRLQVARGFQFYRTVSIYQKPCNCDSNSCSCCETVTILASGLTRKLCANFRYQDNGSTMTINLDNDMIGSTTINNYQPFRSCSSIPGSVFSSVCMDVMELNLFPRSITACLRMDIFSKKQKWQINYNCISLSTVLPSAGNTSSSSSSTVLNGTTGMTGPTTSINSGVNQMPTSQPGQSVQPGSSVQSGQPGQPGQPGLVQPGQPGQLGRPRQPGQPGQSEAGITGQNTCGLMKRQGQVQLESSARTRQIRSAVAKQVAPIKYSQLFTERSAIPVLSTSRTSSLSNPYFFKRKRFSQDKKTASMRMQVVLRKRHNGIPKVYVRSSLKGIPIQKITPTSITIDTKLKMAGIVNRNTASIPMPTQGIGNSIGSGISVNNSTIAATEISNFSNSADATKQSVNKSIPISIPISINNPKSNRDDSSKYFPSRTPPIIELGPRIGSSSNAAKEVEELETNIAQIPLGPNSKFQQTTDTSIVFPE